MSRIRSWRVGEADNIMKAVQIQFTPWDKPYNFDPNNIELEIGDKVVVKTDLGTEIGEVVDWEEVDDSRFDIKTRTGEINGDEAQQEGGSPDAEQGRELKPVLRLATAHDLKKVCTRAEKDKAMKYVKQKKEQLDLPMKFIDVHFSFDGSRITFVFIADGRVDFRELVKELTRHFGRTIRLQQIGIRDEAKIMGDFGHCGKNLCCRGHLRNLASITSEMAEVQQCSHRGSERISGICGRLMCCLAYEQKGYEELSRKMPPIGARVSVDGKKGIVVGYHTLKQTVDVEFKSENGEGKTVVEVDLNRDKKK